MVCTLGNYGPPLFKYVTSMCVLAYQLCNVQNKIKDKSWLTGGPIGVEKIISLQEEEDEVPKDQCMKRGLCICLTNLKIL